MKDVLISVVIPAKNGSETLSCCIHALQRQSVADDLEIIVIDSASTDGTVTIAEKMGVVVKSINSAHFNHGNTRNYALQFCKGDYIYFTVQDAQLANESALSQMLAYFNDPAVAGVCGNQATPHDADKSPVHWYRPVSSPTVTALQFNTHEFEMLSPNKQAEVCAWDNVNAMYRKIALQETPFVQTDFAEDMIWAKHALLKGYKLIRDSGIITWHHHYRTYDYALKVSITMWYHLYREFDVIPVQKPWLLKLIRAVKIIITQKSLKVKERIHWINYEITQIRAERKAVLLCCNALSTGKQSALEGVYQTYCKTVPQGRLKHQV